ncbi:ABC transporter substrate-binding protein [Mobilitalea sibirica]|uniref:ABC transporter substrate-binding protein n=1 Tax=Mobilitalea sibirica TaxID=1462919 RepID=A0A8J7KXS6_9FIRM|nr:ABC transporter substrate-binding protein [Mobilitalea sibirica]MBH1942177.1 ABC transporter substrate-binding protein [Mobilitalea sibirica]
MRKILSVLLITVVIVSLLGGCSSSNKKDSGNGPIKIAVAFPMTGDNAEYGKSFLLAAQIKVDEWNANGGVLGRNIELVNYDDKNSGEEAASIAQKIVSNPEIIGVLGHFSSGVSMVAAPTYEENKVIEISNTASHPDYSSIGKYIFRNNSVISSEFKVIEDIITNDLSLTKVGIVAIKTDWGTTAGAIAADMIKNNPGLELVAQEEVLEGSDDYSLAIAKLQEAGAEVVISVGMYSLIAPLAKQYKAVDPDIQVIGLSNAYAQQLIELGGEAVEGIIFPVSFYADSDEEAVKQFVTAYVEEFGSEPSALAAQAYDSIGILLEAVKQNGSLDKETLRDTLNSITYQGITGETKFDEIGDATKEYTKLIVKDGKFVRYNGKAAQ